jgi:hypothetical protein
MGRTVRWFVVAAVLTAACSTTDPEPIEPSADQNAADVQAALGQTFTLKVGQQARIAGADVTVLFKAVPSDSRCPVDVQCVWAGNARVQLAAGGQELGLNTGEDPRSARLNGHTIELTKLEPDPHSETQIPPANYVATFVVKAVAGQ